MIKIDKNEIKIPLFIHLFLIKINEFWLQVLE